MAFCWHFISYFSLQWCSACRKIQQHSVLTVTPITIYRICIALYKLASSAEYRTVAAVFGVKKLLCNSMWTSLYTLSTKSKGSILNGSPLKMPFIWQTIYVERHCKYPQAIGTIDSTHVPVTFPVDGKADYICRKGYASFVMQGVVGRYYKFQMCMPIPLVQHMTQQSSTVHHSVILCIPYYLHKTRWLKTRLYLTIY